MSDDEMFDFDSEEEEDVQIAPNVNVSDLLVRQIVEDDVGGMSFFGSSWVVVDHRRRERTHPRPSR